MGEWSEPDVMTITYEEEVGGSGITPQVLIWPTQAQRSGHAWIKHGLCEVEEVHSLTLDNKLALWKMLGIPTIHNAWHKLMGPMGTRPSKSYRLNIRLESRTGSDENSLQAGGPRSMRA